VLVFDAIPFPLSVIPESALHGVELPAPAEDGFQQSMAKPALLGGANLQAYFESRKQWLAPQFVGCEMGGDVFFHRDERPNGNVAIKGRDFAPYIGRHLQWLGLGSQHKNRAGCIVLRDRQENRGFLRFRGIAVHVILIDSDD
jgi:hypothetical protein